MESIWMLLWALRLNTVTFRRTGSPIGWFLKSSSPGSNRTGNVKMPSSSNLKTQNNFPLSFLAEMDEMDYVLRDSLQVCHIPRPSQGDDANFWRHKRVEMEWAIYHSRNCLFFPLFPSCPCNIYDVPITKKCQIGNEAWPKCESMPTFRDS